MVTKAEREKRAAEKAAEKERQLKIRERENARHDARENATVAINAAAVKKLCLKTIADTLERDEQLPEWFDRLFGDCIFAAGVIAEEAAEEAQRRAYDAAFIKTYAEALPGLLEAALAALPDPTA